jgi:hypothetical protein
MPYNIPKCPFNKEGQEMHPKFIKPQVDIKKKVELWQDIDELNADQPVDLTPE